ncbi:hypothetical protein ACQ33O_00765 [Ferruginibacter sp. SUN002]|uniref:hypothetical protein n=1 Tax=Ferruginibacter sp. SUN002 TaxID=2937789 RepID=UPI003D36C063
MSKRKWFLIIAVALALFGWYLLFYKTYSKTTIAVSADAVLSIDVKRNANTILAYYLTTPGEWNLNSIFKSRKKKKGSWQKAVEIPDYIFIFHCKGQPASAFYTVLDISDEEDFNSMLAENEFHSGESVNGFFQYASTKLGVDIIKSKDQVLIGNIAVKDKNLIRSVANEIFEKKTYIAEATLKKIVDAPNHFSLYVENENLPLRSVLFNGNFKNGAVTVDASTKPDNKYNFTEEDFKYNNQSILSLGFTQMPFFGVPGSISDKNKSGVSTALNFDVDSLFVRSNKNYQLDIAAIKTKIDSAISYEYDDDFNKIEKVVVNTIQEPSFSFNVTGEDFSGLIDYWKKNKNLELNNDQNLFVSIPFVKTYAITNPHLLSLTSYNYSLPTYNEHVKCIAYLTADPNKIPADLLKYLPESFSKLLSKIESANILVKNDTGNLKFNLTITNKVKNKPFLLSFK